MISLFAADLSSDCDDFKSHSGLGDLDYEPGMIKTWKITVSPGKVCHQDYLLIIHYKIHCIIKLLSFTIYETVQPVSTFIEN